MDWIYVWAGVRVSNLPLFHSSKVIYTDRAPMAAPTSAPSGLCEVCLRPFSSLSFFKNFLRNVHDS